MIADNRLERLWSMSGGYHVSDIEGEIMVMRASYSIRRDEKAKLYLTNTTQIPIKKEFILGGCVAARPPSNGGRVLSRARVLSRLQFRALMPSEQRHR